MDPHPRKNTLHTFIASNRAELFTTIIHLRQYNIGVVNPVKLAPYLSNTAHFLPCINPAIVL